MPDSKPQKIVYLFGAGATHAELASSEESLVSGNVQDEIGLLMKNVSRRVFKKAQQEPIFQKSILDIVTTPGGAENIELFISLLEKNSTNKDLVDAAEKIDLLRQLVEEDITKILTADRCSNFLLHNALFELHHKTSFKDQETLIGIISTNYDTILDEAYKEIYKCDPYYAFPHTEDKNEKIPLLKLHGSFGWDSVILFGKERKIPIMPLGVNKNYLQLPYNYIWGQAFEILVDCDILRIVGCSLNPNDIQLIDLLFQTHLTREKPFVIEIINRQDDAKMFKSNYDFLPKIRLPEEIESNLGIIGVSREKDSPLKGWLKGLGDKLPKTEVGKTTYLKKLI